MAMVIDPQEEGERFKKIGERAKQGKSIKKEESAIRDAG